MLQIYKMSLWKKLKWYLISCSLQDNSTVLLRFYQGERSHFFKLSYMFSYLRLYVATWNVHNICSIKHINGRFVRNKYLNIKIDLLRIKIVSMQRNPNLIQCIDEILFSWYKELSSLVLDSSIVDLYCIHWYYIS